MTKQYKIAILGNEDVITGFKGLGVDVFGLLEKEAEKVVEEVVLSDDYAVLFITEDWVLKLEVILKKFKDRALPAVVAVPVPGEIAGAAFENLKKMVEQAVGSDILFSKK